MMASFMSADAQRLLQLRTQLARLDTSKQQLSKLEDVQQAALISVIDDIATLEKQNIQLKQSLLLSLRSLDAKPNGHALQVRCAQVARQLGLLHQGSTNEHSLQSASKTQDLFKIRALTEPDPEPFLASPASPQSLPCKEMLEAHSSQESLPPLTKEANILLGVPMKFGTSQALGLESEQSSDNAAETEKTEPSSSGSSSNVAWPAGAMTVLIRNMPPRSSIDELIKAFPPDGSYDFIHLPFHVKARRTSSFATINFISVDLAEAFCERFDGQRLPHSMRPCKNPLSVVPARVQGLEANLTFLAGEKGINETRNPALLPRLFLSGAAAERLAAAAPRSIGQPDAPGQPQRLDFREALRALHDAEVYR